MMTEKQKEYEAELLKVIKEKKIAVLCHAFGFTSFCSATAYNHDIEKLESIKNAINENKARAKTYMLMKWVESDNATLQVAAYRLLSTPEEHRLLNQQYTDHTTKGEKINIVSLGSGIKPDETTS